MHPFFLFVCFLNIFKLSFIGVQLIYNVALVSAVQQSESVIHIHISTLFQILFPYRSLQSIEQSSLSYTEGSFFFPSLFIYLFILSRFLLVIYFIHISVYMSIPISQFIPPPSPHPPAFPLWCPYVCSLHLCLYFCLANGFICTIFF